MVGKPEVIAKSNLSGVDQSGSNRLLNAWLCQVLGSAQHLAERRRISVGRAMVGKNWEEMS
jgi:hypothetical protein